MHGGGAHSWHEGDAGTGNTQGGAGRPRRRHSAGAALRSARLCNGVDDDAEPARHQEHLLALRRERRHQLRDSRANLQRAGGAPALCRSVDCWVRGRCVESQVKAQPAGARPRPTETTNRPSGPSGLCTALSTVLWWAQGTALWRASMACRRVAAEQRSVARRTFGGWPARKRSRSSREGCITPRRPASASWNSTDPPMALHASKKCAWDICGRSPACSIDRRLRSCLSGGSGSRAVPPGNWHNGWPGNRALAATTQLAALTWL